MYVHAIRIVRTILKKKKQRTKRTYIDLKVYKKAIVILTVIFA